MKLAVLLVLGSMVWMGGNHLGIGVDVHHHSALYAEPAASRRQTTTPLQIRIVRSLDDNQARFYPDSLEVPLGATVEFTNADTAWVHDVRWFAVGSNPTFAHDLGPIQPGETIAWKFIEPGEVDIVCSVIPSMHARLVVAPHGGD